MNPNAPPNTQEKNSRKLSFLKEGLLGFENLLHYELALQDEESPFYEFTALEDSHVSFLVIEPHVITQDYIFDIPEEEAVALDIKSPDDVFVLILLTIPDNPMEMTANLLGPLVFNKQSNLGCQLVLDQKKYPLRFPVFENEAEEGEA